MIYVKYSISDLGSIIIKQDEIGQILDVIKNELCEVEIGGVSEDYNITIAFVEMDEKEYAQLPEFEGW